MEEKVATLEKSTKVTAEKVEKDQEVRESQQDAISMGVFPPGGPMHQQPLMIGYNPGAAPMGVQQLGGMPPMGGMPPGPAPQGFGGPAW